MFETETAIVTADGDMGAFIVHPRDDGPHPVVLFYMDAPGKREELHDMARRIATTGYYVVLPNLYYRRTPAYEIQSRSDEARAEMFGHMNSLSNAMIVADTQSMLDHVDADDNADSENIGCVGYCMSGPFSLTVAAAYADRISAAASMYGVRLAIETEDSPHLRFGEVKGELYIGCAEVDDWAPEEMVQLLEATVQSSGVNATVERYPGTEHGFAFPNRPVYNKAAAEVHWRRLHSLFDRNLKGQR